VRESRNQSVNNFPGPVEVDRATHRCVASLVSITSNCFTVDDSVNLTPPLLAGAQWLQHSHSPASASVMTIGLDGLITWFWSAANGWADLDPSAEDYFWS
jgi:hypothetical protein